MKIGMKMKMRMTLCVEWWLTDDGLAPMADSFRSANFVKTEIFHNARPGYCVINGFSTISTASSCLAKAAWQLHEHFFSCICSIFLQCTLFCGFHNDFGISNCPSALHQSFSTGRIYPVVHSEKRSSLQSWFWQTRVKSLGGVNIFPPKSSFQLAFFPRSTKNLAIYVFLLA